MFLLVALYCKFKAKALQYLWKSLYSIYIYLICSMNSGNDNTQIDYLTKDIKNQRHLVFCFNYISPKMESGLKKPILLFFFLMNMGI